MQWTSSTLTAIVDAANKKLASKPRTYVVAQGNLPMWTDGTNDYTATEKDILIRLDTVSSVSDLAEKMQKALYIGVEGEEKPGFAIFQGHREWSFGLPRPADKYVPASTGYVYLVLSAIWLPNSCTVVDYQVRKSRAAKGISPLPVVYPKKHNRKSKRKAK